MTKQTGTIITIVLAVVVACPSIFCCLFGALTAAGQGTFTGISDQTGQIPPAVGVGLICLSLIGLLVPVASWFLLVRGKTA